MQLPLFVGRPSSIRALEMRKADDAPIRLATQKRVSEGKLELHGLYETATLASMPEVLPLPDGTIKVLAHARHRVRLIEALDMGDHQAGGESLVDEADGGTALVSPRALKEAFGDFVIFDQSTPAFYVVAAVEETNLAMATDLSSPRMSGDVSWSALPTFRRSRWPKGCACAPPGSSVEGKEGKDRRLRDMLSRDDADG